MIKGRENISLSYVQFPYAGYMKKFRIAFQASSCRQVKHCFAPWCCLNNWEWIRSVTTGLFSRQLIFQNLFLIEWKISALHSDIHSFSFKIYLCMMYNLLRRWPFMYIVNWFSNHKTLICFIIIILYAHILRKSKMLL